MINLTEKEKQIVTSLRVKSSTWKQAKIEAIKNDLTLTELVDEALRDWIKRKRRNKNARNF